MSWIVRNHFKLKEIWNELIPNEDINHFSYLERLQKLRESRDVEAQELLRKINNMKGQPPRRNYKDFLKPFSSKGRARRAESRKLNREEREETVNEVEDVMRERKYIIEEYCTEERRRDYEAKIRERKNKEIYELERGKKDEIHRIEGSLAELEEEANKRLKNFTNRRKVKRVGWPWTKGVVGESDDVEIEERIGYCKNFKWKCKIVRLEYDKLVRFYLIPMLDSTCESGELFPLIFSVTRKEDGKQIAVDGIYGFKTSDHYLRLKKGFLKQKECRSPMTMSDIRERIECGDLILKIEDFWQVKAVLLWQDQWKVSEIKGKILSVSATVEVKNPGEDSENWIDIECYAAKSEDKMRRVFVCVSLGDSCCPKLKKYASGFIGSDRKLVIPVTWSELEVSKRLDWDRKTNWYRPVPISVTIIDAYVFASAPRLIAPSKQYGQIAATKRLLELLFDDDPKSVRSNELCEYFQLERKNQMQDMGLDEFRRLIWLTIQDMDSGEQDWNTALVSKVLDKCLQKELTFSCKYEYTKPVAEMCPDAVAIRAGVEDEYVPIREYFLVPSGMLPCNPSIKFFSMFKIKTKTYNPPMDECKEEEEKEDTYPENGTADVQETAGITDSMSMTNPTADEDVQKTADITDSMSMTNPTADEDVQKTAGNTDSMSMTNPTADEDVQKTAGNTDSMSMTNPTADKDVQKTAGNTDSMSMTERKTNKVKKTIGPRKAGLRTSNALRSSTTKKAKVPTKKPKGMLERKQKIYCTVYDRSVAEVSKLFQQIAQYR